MTKVTAGVVTGIALGAAYGVLSAWGEPRMLDLFVTILGRASQGIINGVLAAYAAPGRTPMWRAMLFSGLIGLALGAVGGFASRDWAHALPFGAFIGVACGAAVARARG